MLYESSSILSKPISEELETAALLLESNRYRTSISRAYYSMYYATQALLISENINTGTHKGLIKLFRSILWTLKKRAEKSYSSDKVQVMKESAK